RDNLPFSNPCAVRAAYRFRAAFCRLKRISREMPDLRQAGWEMRTLVLTDCLCADLLQVQRKRFGCENAV
ncbi:hypothetical protein MM708_31090, partial [Klebsiella pneumoniae]|nr:hypothetical protein [Klebsiella pneumoniae]